MSIHVAIDHSTTYEYDRPVVLSPHWVRLCPAPHTRTPVHDYSLTVTPEDHCVFWQDDPCGNRIARIIFPRPTTRLELRVQLVAEMTVLNPFDFFVEAYAEEYPFAYGAALHGELEPYLSQVDDGPLLRQWVSRVDRRPQRIVDFLVSLNQRLRETVDYALRFDPGVQTSEETLGRKVGSCRDSAWLLSQILRKLGLAARFVSGYLIQLTADEKSLDGPSGPEADFTDLHAWTEVYVPGAGWIGLDPTSGLLAGEGHIPLACTPDPVSAAPVAGAMSPCEVEFRYHNEVRRVFEPPRVTKPYTDQQWEEIRKLGREIDAELASADVRLTMGGEPTFVSIDDMEGDEWTTGALGAHKRERADDLVRRLRDVFGPGGVVLAGQGKWYPGEPIPRWALSCFWRRDGQALWRDHQLIAPAVGRVGKVVAADAERFGHALARRLGCAPEHLCPAFEDWLHYLWREAKQPADRSKLTVSGTKAVPDDSAAALSRGLDEPVGYVLPLHWDGPKGHWVAHTWTFPGGRMFLHPGSSAMGLRLPLTRRTNAGTPFALCVECRAGRLHVFLPPVDGLASIVELLTAIEDVARELDLPLVLEGYKPRAPELRSLEVTPDPGVIEVNIHPAATWEDLEERVTSLYEQARLARLGTEKFMVDGRHTGTGGGNHITIGGASAEDSPFLRRPDLLVSLVTYWQHHPGLSYLFSGQFIGPTSQAPRIDERGASWFREIEQSFDEIAGDPQPSIVDGALRNFLTDLTGNTHRAEICIDKLWSPDGAHGKQGLVELRAFEMPPHPRMSLAQMLLVRALVAYLWREPYRHALVEWSTALHDRFLLPHFIWADFLSVVDELRAAGFALEADWYEPFFAFRFPLCGRVRYEGVDIELRTALEPWLVVGDDVTAQQESRAVDASVERVQVRCRGLDPDRFALLCNGQAVPLRPTGVGDERVAGVRFKGWPCEFGLHPTMPVHAPLTFDLWDRRLDRSIGSCVYHVSHPGGRAFDTFPVNAFEAEARRIARFWPWGDTVQGGLVDGALPGRATAPGESAPNPDYPYTLDLRREVAR